VPNAIDDADLYGSIVLAGVRSPGVVTLSGHNRKIGWDVKKAPGQSGASTTRTSEDPVEFTASFFLVKDDAQGIDDISAWPAFLDLIKSTVAGTTPKALDIYQPDLAENDIKSVVLSEIGGVVHDGMGGQTRTIKFLEYRPAKAKGGSPSGSNAKPKAKTSPGVNPNDPNAAANAELEALRKQYEATPWG
jgi:hypothetical protein